MAFVSVLLRTSEINELLLKIYLSVKTFVFRVNQRAERAPAKLIDLLIGIMLVCPVATLSMI